MQLYLSLMSLSSLPIWRDERLLFMRERAAGRGPGWGREGWERGQGVMRGRPRVKKRG